MIDHGRAFHSLGAAVLKAWSPKPLSLLRGTVNWLETGVQFSHISLSWSIFRIYSRAWFGMQGMIYKKQHLEIDSLHHKEPVWWFQHRSDIVKQPSTTWQPHSVYVAVLRDDWGRSYKLVWISRAGTSCVGEIMSSVPSQSDNLSSLYLWHE